MSIFLFHPIKYLWKLSERRPRGPSFPCTVYHRSKLSSWWCSKDFQAGHCLILLFLAKTLFKYSVVSLTARESALSCMRTMILQNANFCFFAMWWGASSESGCRLWQSFWLHLRLWMAEPVHYQWLQPKISHRHTLADAWSGEDVGPLCSTSLSSIYRVHRGSQDTHRWITQQVTKMAAVCLLLSRSL